MTLFIMCVISEKGYAKEIQVPAYQYIHHLLLIIIT